MYSWNETSFVYILWLFLSLERTSHYKTVICSSFINIPPAELNHSSKALEKVVILGAVAICTLSSIAYRCSNAEHCIVSCIRRVTTCVSKSSFLFFYRMPWQNLLKKEASNERSLQVLELPNQAVGIPAVQQQRSWFLAKWLQQLMSQLHTHLCNTITDTEFYQCSLILLSTAGTDTHQPKYKWIFPIIEEKLGSSMTPIFSTLHCFL